MRILHIIDFHPEYHKIYGGAEIATLRLAEKLKEKGVENFFLITYPDKNLNVKENFIPLKTIYHYIDFKNLKSFKSKILSIIDFYKIIFPFDVIVFFNSFKIFRKIKPDLVHFHNFKKISFSVLLTSKFFKVKSLLTIYDYWFFCPKETLIYKNNEICKFYNSWRCFNCFPIRFRYRIFLPLRKYIFNFFLRFIDGFIFLSQSSLKIGKEYGISEKKSRVIPQIFENYEENEFQIPEGNIILYVGWVQYRKGLHVLIDALEIILKEMEVILFVIGEIENVEKEYVEEIFKKIKEKKIEKYVKMIGKVEKKKVKEYIKKAKVVVIPEQWENMSPVVLVESMFLKKAIVASRIGGIPEFIEDGIDGFLCEPKNPVDFAEKILKILEDENLLFTFGENAYKKAKNIWDSEKNIEKVINFYKEIKNG